MVTKEELQQLIEINNSWRSRKSQANSIFAKYEGKEIKISCGKCVQILRNWVLKQIHG